MEDGGEHVTRLSLPVFEVMCFRSARILPFRTWSLALGGFFSDFCADFCADLGSLLFNLLVRYCFGLL